MPMTLREFLQVNEEKNKINKIISYAIKNYNKEELVSKIEKKAQDEYIPSNWEAEAESEMEWYSKYGQNQAENDIFNEIINKASEKKGIKLTSSEKADLQNWFYNAYNI